MSNGSFAASFPPGIDSKSKQYADDNRRPFGVYAGPRYWLISTHNMILDIECRHILVSLPLLFRRARMNLRR